MLYQVGRYREALEAAETGLAANPRSLGCRTSKAQVLLSVERPQEALSMLRELAVERDTAPIELHLGMALLLSGEPASAWERFSRLLKKERTRDEPAVLTDSLYAELQLQAARALNKLERPREAAEVCLERLLGEPECEPVLHQLASSARALGAAPGAGALDLRLRRIQTREALRESALRAHHAGQEALAAFQLAQAELSVDRTGEALKLLLEARKSFRRIPQLHLETARVQSLVGRDDLAEATLREGIRDCATAALFSELARLLAEQGGEGAAEARRILAGLPAGLPASGEGAEGRLDEAVHLTARRARAHLELGDVPGARGVLAGGGASVERDPAALLARAEAALFERRFDDARRLLAESYQNLPGGPAWAAALKTCLDAVERTEAGDGAPLAGFDPSDLLDHPRLLLHPALSGPRFERLRAAHRRRRDLLAASNGTAGRESLARWREVLALYQDLGAGRKAREAAWYLCSIFPDDLEASRFLVRALSSPEEVVLRLRVLKSALRLAPGDVELRSMFAGSRASLGLSE
jgi:tetratricopeptide (TPR) repeat protein